MAAKNPRLQSVSTDAADLTARDARERLAAGSLRALELTNACLQRIAVRDTEVRAWAHVNERHALDQAEMLDRYRQTGRAPGQLHGLPVGIVDTVDTADLPTENGSRLDAGRQPTDDASVVTRLRAGGAVIPGKTATTECAGPALSETCNPHDPERLAGGPSCGAAAAVAGAMVPLAVGADDGDSIIRSASYCGVVGFKPSFGLIPRSGILRTSPTLSTVGVFARTVEDAAMLVDTIAGHDPVDSGSILLPSPRLLDIALSSPPVTPQLALVKSPAWEAVDADTAEGFGELVDALGERCDEIELPGIFTEGAIAHQRIMQAELACNLRHYHARGAELLGEPTRAIFERGGAIRATEYLAALDWRETLYTGFEEIFERYDVIVAPAAPGEAPLRTEEAESLAFDNLWSLTGVPAIALPLLKGGNALPIGVQLIGRRQNDARLLRTARWLIRYLAEEA